MEFHFRTDNKKENVAIPKQDYEEFPAPGILLSVLQTEYEQEKLRAERIDNKAVALLTILIALITVYVPIFPFDQLLSFYGKEWACRTLPNLLSIFLVMGIIAIILAVISANNLVGIFKAKEYRGVDFEKFNTNQNLGVRSATKFQLDLVDHYQPIILKNAEINAKKAQDLNKQLYCIIAVFIMLSISAIGTLIIVGIQ